MSRVTTRDTVPEDRLARILAPRDDAVVRETVDGQGFEADSGPFDAYRRTVTMERRDDGSADVEQVVTFRLALPVFGPLVVPLFRSHLRRLEPRQKAPWWAPVERIDPPAARTLAGLGTVAVVIGYVLTVLPQTITFAASQFHADKTAQGVALASTRADIVFVIVLVALADRHGRQRLLLLSTALASVFTALGALAPSLAWLAVTQVGASGCGSAAVVLIAIMAAEAMPRSARAYALSLLTVVGSIGIGALLGLLFIADFSRGSWRVLYAIGIVGVPLVIAIGRRLPESPRYLAPHADAPLAGHGRRLWLLAIAGLLINVFIAPSSEFLNDFLRVERHYNAATISLFIAITGIPGGIGLMAGGRLAETRGRRGVAALAVLVMAGFTTIQFLSRSALMWAASAISTIGAAAIVPAFGIYGPELFPTGLRGRANAIIQGLGRVGSVIGLIVVGRLADHIGTYGPALALVAIGPLAMVVLILVAFPETAHQELEDLNPEDKSPQD